MFWVVLLVVTGAGAGVLQYMGPPGSPAARAENDAGALPPPLRNGAPGDAPGHAFVAHAPERPAPPAKAASDTTASDTTARDTTARDTTAPDAHPAETHPSTPQSALPPYPRPPGTAIPPPQAALLAPAPDFPASRLPVVGPGSGAEPRKIYAGGFDPLDARPRVALMIAGIGLPAANSDDAIQHLPAAVTLAYSPYAAAPNLSAARARGHELMISVPMEPAGYPLEDAGAQSLLTGGAPEDNRRRLEWALSRIEGYAGVTGALGRLRGERFARSGEQMGRMATEIAERGLYYIDPRAGEAPPAGTTRAIDVVIDDQPEAASVDAALARLETLAVDHGSALGLVGAPRPVTVDRLAAWAGKLATHGVVLVPVSALFAPPAAAPTGGRVAPTAPAPATGAVGTRSTGTNPTGASATGDKP